MLHMASVVIMLTRLPNSTYLLCFFSSVYSDNSLGLLSFAYLQYLCLVDKYIINIYSSFYIAPLQGSLLRSGYSFLIRLRIETVFYLFIFACRPLWLLAIIACHLKTAIP